MEETQSEIDALKQKKLNYVNLFTDDIISREELVEYRDLTDNKIKELQSKKTQLNEKINECEDENYSISIGKKLKDVLSLEELTPQILHSLVEKITCTDDGEIHIQYTFVNPLQVVSKLYTMATSDWLVAFFLFSKKIVLLPSFSQTLVIPVFSFS